MNIHSDVDIAGNTVLAKIPTTVRWIAFVPAGLAASWLVEPIFRGNPVMNLPVQSLALILVGAYLAPKSQRIVALALTALGVLSTISALHGYLAPLAEYIGWDGIFSETWELFIQLTIVYIALSGGAIWWVFSQVKKLEVGQGVSPVASGLGAQSVAPSLQPVQSVPTSAPTQPVQPVVPAQQIPSVQPVQEMAPQPIVQPSVPPAEQPSAEVAPQPTQQPPTPPAQG